MTTELEGNHSPPQIRDNKVTQLARACSNCRKIKTCYIYKDMSAIVKLWNSQNELKFPFAPEIMAQNCDDFESPLDVIVLAEKTQEANTQ